MNIEEYIASGILESYVLGFTTDQENALLECLIKTNPTVADEVRAIQETLELTALKGSIEPPENIKAKIWSELQKEPISFDQTEEKLQEEELPIFVSEEKKETKVIRMNWLNIAASLILILTSSSFALYYYFKANDMNQQLAQLEVDSKKMQDKNTTNQTYLAFLAHNQTERVVLAGVPTKPNAKATVFWNKENKHVMISELNLPKAPENMQYQLWALVDGKPVDAGMIDLDPANTLLEMKEIDNSQAFAITLEPMGGSASPHLEDLFVIGNIN